MASEGQDIKRQTLLGRAYFLAVLPFIGAVAGPWIFGPGASDPTPAFVVWSFSVLLVVNAAITGYSLALRQKHIYLQTLVALLICALGIACLLFTMARQQPFAPVAVLTVLHWLTWLWMQKTASLQADAYKQHSRFVWSLLACHMLVLLNVIYAIKVN